MTQGEPLFFGRDSGGRRHFLDGKEVRCGKHIELQAVGINEWILVRYEASLFRGDDCVVTLYTDIGGHTAVIRHYDSMRFRWPR